MNDKRREQALAVYYKHNTGNANANYYERRDSAVASMLAFASDQMAEKDAEIARLRADARFREETTSNCWCKTCRPITLQDMRMVLCPECGNKRCPHATDHNNECTARKDTK